MLPGAVSGAGPWDRAILAGRSTLPKPQTPPRPMKLETTIAARLCRAAPVVLLLLAIVITCSDGNDSVSRAPVEDWLENPQGGLPPTLAELGLFSDPANETLSEGIIAYTVRQPRFADGNRSNYYLFLPEGASIDNSNPDSWRFPVGTAFFETVYLTVAGGDSPAPRKIETRALHKATAGWSVGSYRWNDIGSEARLVEGLEDVVESFARPEGSYTYTIPKKISCLTCHQNKPDYIIGFDELQLNVPATNDGPGQLEQLRARGAFTHPDEIRELDIAGASDLERDVLSYFLSNCSYCHHPESSVYRTNQLDLRREVLQQHIIDTEPVRLATPDGTTKLIAPGEPENSLMYLLMTRTHPDPTLHMPPLGTSFPDSEAIDRLRQWISEL